MAEILAEVDDILSIDSYIRYINKRVHTACFLLRVINTLATNYTLTVDRHMYFAVDVLGLTKSLTILVKFQIHFAIHVKSKYIVCLFHSFDSVPLTEYR